MSKQSEITVTSGEMRAFLLVLRQALLIIVKYIERNYMTPGTPPVINMTIAYHQQQAAHTVFDTDPTHINQKLP